ncbi:FAD-dependent oxidoreductase [Lentibacillus amyloliquefaciens]|uniref:Amine oxidase domain-containing protein n=1 Tax=Lentibacillus amyloliquefaciens TaxID=1472767 RepID=A0A0U4GBD7_9BACI|nr:FAD-dependent oxidoreductase [Lentibacillus amyloliquefaciens]ALX50042.1 hypothetical protein AOX59_16525 [Lentibacillus amyloliquefaciens]
MTHSRIEMDHITHKTGKADCLSIDTAIIGAGVSGLYAGYRLLSGDFMNDKHRPDSVHIFEMDTRVGGRLESITLPDMNVTGEMGGMHYDTSYNITTTLIEDIFQLHHTPFPSGDPNDYLYYLRGKHFKGDEWARAQDRGKCLRYLINCAMWTKGIGSISFCKRLCITC